MLASHQRKIFPFFYLFLTAVALSACTTLRNLDERTPPPGEVIVRPASSSQGVEKYVDQFALMALFANIVYRDDLNSSERKNKACIYIGDPSHRHVKLDMPQGLNGDGWQRWTLPGACYNAHGLYYETYVHFKNGHINEAVIAIRGTEGSDLNDWKANLSGVVDFAETEYNYAMENILPLISSLKNNFKVEKIFLTAHSLGGGVAQEIAFASKEVDETFTFNTSPVTNWTRLHNDHKDVNPDPVIHRIYQGHEVLAYLRNVTTRFNDERFFRNDYRFGFVKGDVLNSHAINHLACQFAARVSAQNGAAHYYSRQNAEAVLRDKVLCPNTAIEQIPPDMLQTEPMCQSEFSQQVFQLIRSSAPGPGSCRP